MKYFLLIFFHICRIPVNAQPSFEGICNKILSHFVVEISSSSPPCCFSNVTGKVLHTPEKQQDRVVFSMMSKCLDCKFCLEFTL